MSTYVYMKLLESAPERYDAGIHRLSRGRIDAVYERIAELAARPGSRLMDIGCGTGGVSLACASRGAEVVGVDMNGGMLDVAQRKVDKASLSGSVELARLSAMEIGDRFAAESFDAIVSCLLFSELVREERTYLLKLVQSCLKPGGLLVVADEVVPKTLTGRLRRGLLRLPSVLWTYLVSQQTTQPVPDLRGEVAAAGFSDVREERLSEDDFAIVVAKRGV